MIFATRAALVAAGFGAAIGCTPVPAPPVRPAVAPNTVAAPSEEPRPRSTSAPANLQKPEAPSTELAEPARCLLWDPTTAEVDAAHAAHAMLVRWGVIGRERTSLVYAAAMPRAELEARMPVGYRIHAVTTAGPRMLARMGYTTRRQAYVESVETKPVLLFEGDAVAAPVAALFVPRACVHGAPALRALHPERLGPLLGALARASATLHRTLAPADVVVARARLGGGASYVVNHLVQPRDAYPSSTAFTMKADGTVVDMLYEDASPHVSWSFPYAVDLDGDGVDELLQIESRWEVGDSLHLFGWRDGALRSVLIDDVDRGELPPHG